MSFSYYLCPWRQSLEESLSAQRTCGFVARCEPFIQTGGVELLFAGTAGFLWQRVIGSVNDREADHTVLHPLKTLVNIVLPQRQTFQNTAILVCEVRAELKHPIAPLLNGHTHSPPTLH